MHCRGNLIKFFFSFSALTDKPKAVRLMGNSYFPGQMQVANLQCDFMGYPTKIKWFKGRDELPVTQFGQFFHTTEKLVSYPTHQRSILSIYYVVDEAFDRYTCVGYNDFGNGSGVVELSSKIFKTFFFVSKNAHEYIHVGVMFINLKCYKYNY